MDKQELLGKVRLYVIADKKICGDRSIEEVVSRAIDGGADMIQYRDKESEHDDFVRSASSLRDLCKEREVPFIVNDRVVVAFRVDADGVHLGQEDIPIRQARGILGSEKIIGKSATTIRQAKAAEEEGADYIGLGPIFDTASKQIGEPIGVDVVRRAESSLEIPCFPIGGINLTNLEQIIRAGGRRIAVISAVVSSDDAKSSAGELLGKLGGQNLT